MPLANLTPSPRFLLREKNLENANSRNSVTLINIEHLLHLKATAAPRIVGNILHFSLQIFFCLLFAAIFLPKFRRKLISLLQLQYFVANKWSRLSLHPYCDHFMNKMFGLKVCRYKSPTGLKVLICKHRFSHQIVNGQASPSQVILSHLDKDRRRTGTSPVSSSPICILRPLGNFHYRVLNCGGADDRSAGGDYI